MTTDQEILNLISDLRADSEEVERCKDKIASLRTELENEEDDLESLKLQISNNREKLEELIDEATGTEEKEMSNPFERKDYY